MSTRIRHVTQRRVSGKKQNKNKTAFFNYQTKERDVNRLKHLKVCEMCKEREKKNGYIFINKILDANRFLFNEL